MKLLALDSSGNVASVAVTEDDRLIGEYTVDHGKTHSQTLLPMLDEVKKMIELDLSSVDAIAIAAGPGSFTGLRIGSATAKGLAEALNKPIVEVPTVEALAFNMYGYDGLICPIMDARRNQVYAGLYRFEEDPDTEEGYRMLTVKEQFVGDFGELLAEIEAMQTKVVFLGDAVALHKETIKDTLHVPFGFAPANCNRQHAACVAALGRHLLLQGKSVAAGEHKPIYLRLSQAERERAERERAEREDGAH
ncbi:MAG: tRNA (adenosine(37)-N6)-threonylcarbamoyltransferase complex dimerization subunit type 1 TsaB [Lachnospiraceae bacterium]|nr:tRNA (adenosine(37)-N6)-threonylcarbamoyltransferase complex dimerization subunit type 1 TsaB [Lachnospiraceae bacterium]